MSFRLRILDKDFVSKLLKSDNPALLADHAQVPAASAKAPVKKGDTAIDGGIFVICCFFIASALLIDITVQGRVRRREPRSGALRQLRILDRRMRWARSRLRGIRSKALCHFSLKHLPLCRPWRQGPLLSLRCLLSPLLLKPTSSTSSRSRSVSWLSIISISRLAVGRMVRASPSSPGWPLVRPPSTMVIAASLNPSAPSSLHF